MYTFQEGKDIVTGSLYIAPEDLKERYRGAKAGLNRMKAYVNTLKRCRMVEIILNRKDNGTIQFTIKSSDLSSVLTEVKQDLQGELCSVSPCNYRLLLVM